MADMKHLTGSVVTKDADAGTFTVIASMATLDRDREIIDPGAFNPLPKTVPMHTDHKMSVGNLVGRGRPYYDGATLKVDGVFSTDPEAQRVRRLVKEGILDSVSVGFITAKHQRDSNGIDHITSGELIEVSFVTVPSNREALVLAAKRHRTPTCDLARVKTLAAIAQAEMLLLDTAPTDVKTTITRAKALIADLERKDRRRG